MKNDAMVTCPKCKHEFKLADATAGPLIEEMRKDFEAQLRQQGEQATRDQNALRASIQKEAELKAKQSVKKDEEALRAEMSRALEKTQQMAEQLQEREAKLAEAQKVQADLLKKSRALDDERREMELTIEKRISEQLDAARGKGRAEAESALSLRLAEKEQAIASMQTTIAELKQKAEQGSMQLQGEVQELELEKVLRAKFPHDVISEVPKGINGADCMQEVKDSSGRHCGTIIWESKRTKSWSDGWLPKLRDDQRTAKADIAILVSQVLPKDVTAFDFIDGVYVTELQTVLPLTIALRRSIIDIALARDTGEGQKTKMEILYKYMTGLQFRQRVQAIVEAFTTMSEDLFRERKAVTKAWAKREEQIQNVMESTVGMFGDIQGIAGKAVQEIEGLEIRQIEKDPD